MKGRPIAYSNEELRWIEAHRSLPRRDLHARFVERFGRDDVSLVNLAALCKRRGWLTGRTGRFEPGQASWNKGRRMPFHPNSAAHWFRKGERHGVATRLYQPIGTEIVRGDGYVWRKVNDGLPLQTRWRQVHVIRWEEANGTIPDGHCLKCVDGDRANTDPANWVAIPRALLPRLNGRFGRDFDSAPPELKPIILKIARLEHEAREKGRQND